MELLLGTQFDKFIFVVFWFVCFGFLLGFLALWLVGFSGFSDSFYAHFYCYDGNYM